MADPINGASSDWLAITQNAIKDGGMYFDAGIRREIEQDVRQFQGLHPLSSKYLSDSYRARSKFFSPKTRATIRKNEAVAAAAFFSNTDVVEVTPWDDSDKFQQGAAELQKELLTLRLKRSIPWFQISMGAYQEAQAVGLVCAHVYWKTDGKRGIDQPMVDLVPIENMVFSPAAQWFDVVGTSPYLIRKIPMFVKDVKARMKTAPGKTETNRWQQLDDNDILTSVRAYSDSIRLAREQGRGDSQSQASSITPYQLVWVYETIADIDGEDYIWHSLGESKLLSKGRKLSASYWHGHRPYVIGYSVIEAHKVYPPGVSRLTRDIQGMINSTINQRHDNVSFAMNKRYFAKRGAQVDIRSLTRNVPSSVTLMNDVDKDVKVQETKDVTSSAYEEQDRFANDFDELAGSNTKSARGDPDNLANKVGGAEMLAEDANQIQGYQLRTFTETFMEPVLYQVMRLEQHYETDEDILRLCGKKADLQKKGINDISDSLLMQELSLAIHVGIGATSPRKQLDNLLFAFAKIKELLEGGELQQFGLNVEEMMNEIFGKLGYKTAERFFKWDDQDPQVVALNNQVQQLTDALKNKKDPPEVIAAKVQLLQAQVKKTLNEAFNVNVEGLFGSMQAAEVVAAVPAVAPVADTIAKAAGYEPPQPTGQDPGIQPAGAPPVAPAGPAPAQDAAPALAAPAPGAQPPAPAGPSAPAAGLSVQPVTNAKTGIGFTPGSASQAPVTAKPGGSVQAQLPPGVAHNTHPDFPAKPQSADAGTHGGIEGGQDKHAALLMAMHGTLKQLNTHMSKKKPAVNIVRDGNGNATRFEPEE